MNSRAVRQPLVAVLAVPSLLGLAACVVGCAAMAIGSAPEKTAKPATSQEVKAANAAFWESFHGGQYQELPHVLDRLTAAYLENPGDAETAAHLGFAHVWQLGERARLERVPPTITDHIIVGRKYFAEAVRLAPDDVRLQGFLATLEMGEGTVHGDEKLTRRGYFDLLAAKDAWPEFNLFTAGYVLSVLPVTDPKFNEAVEYQWETLDRCAEQKVNRSDLQYAQFMGKETHEGRKRVCWNSWIAPHNFEGFFLNMGDMLVKQGDPQTARRVYGMARLSRTYETWPYRSVLEERITQATENVALFREERPGEKTRVMMLRSTFACTGCHQDSAGPSAGAAR